MSVEDMVYLSCGRAEMIIDYFEMIDNSPNLTLSCD
jgi:hypothetical protein